MDQQERNSNASLQRSSEKKAWDLAQENLDRMLFSCAKKGRVRFVRILINRGANVESRFDGSTSLNIAAKNGYLNVCEILINAGANINSRDALNFTALHYAIENGHKDLVTLLLKNRNDLSFQLSKNLKQQAAINSENFLLEKKEVKNSSSPHELNKKIIKKTLVRQMMTIEEGNDLNSENTEEGDVSKNQGSVLNSQLSSNDSFNFNDLSISETHSSQELFLPLLEKSPRSSVESAKIKNPKSNCPTICSIS